MQDYDHFIISILDRNHSFTYGLEKNNQRDLKTIQKIETDARYCGLIIDKNGYPNNFLNITKNTFNVSSISSKSGRYIFVRTDILVDKKKLEQFVN